MTKPYIDGTTIIVPMNAFAFYERRTGHVRCCAGWVPACTQVVALDKHNNRLAIPLPVVSALDTLSVYEDTHANRSKLWTRLLCDELPNEMFRAKQLFERDRPEELSWLIDIELKFEGLCDALYSNVMRLDSVAPPEMLGFCDMSEQCLGALMMLALERTAG
jgi:hypothetical protein